MKEPQYRMQVDDIFNAAHYPVGYLMNVEHSVLNSTGTKRILINKFKAMVMAEYPRYILVKVLNDLGSNEYFVSINKIDIDLGDYTITPLNIAHAY